MTELWNYWEKWSVMCEIVCPSLRRRVIKRVKKWLKMSVWFQQTEWKRACLSALSTAWHVSNGNADIVGMLTLGFIDAGKRLTLVSVSGAEPCYSQTDQSRWTHTVASKRIWTRKQNLISNWVIYFKEMAQKHIFPENFFQKNYRSPGWWSNWKWLRKVKLVLKKIHALIFYLCNSWDSYIFKCDLSVQKCPNTAEVKNSKQCTIEL